MKCSIPATKYPEGGEILTEKDKVVFEIQQMLRNISKSKGASPSVIPDGIYSSQTEELVKAFQLSSGLPDTGRVDYHTFEALKKENARAVFKEKPPLQVIAIESEDLPLSLGDDNEFVRMLKIMLDSVALRHGNFERLEADSVFDRKTQNAVKQWQGIAFTEESGIADKVTWNSLASFYLTRTS